MSKILNITTDTLEAQLKAALERKVKVILIVGAKWDGASKATHMNGIKWAESGEHVVLSADADENPALVRKFETRKIPIVAVYDEKGRLVTHTEGSEVSDASLAEMLKLKAPKAVVAE